MDREVKVGAEEYPVRASCNALRQPTDKADMPYFVDSCMPDNIATRIFFTDQFFFFMQGSQPPPREGITVHNTPEGTPSYERSFKSDTSPSTSCSQAGQTSDEPTCSARSGGEVRQLGRISSDCQYEDNSQRSDAVHNLTAIVAHPSAEQARNTYPNVRDPKNRLGRKSMASFVLPEQTVSLRLNNLNEPPVLPISGADDADVCTVQVVKNEWETTQGTSKARFSGGRIVGKTVTSFASENNGAAGKAFIYFGTCFYLCLILP